jgi:type IV pilus assembly protein PilB
MLIPEIDTATRQLITSQQAWFYQIVPKALNNNLLELYIAEENDVSSLKEELELLIGREIKFFSLPAKDLLPLLSRNYRRSNHSVAKDYKADIGHKDFLNMLISEAFDLDSSDIHIEVYEEKARVRFRIDGKLLEKYIIPRNEYPALINKIKIKASLDISEKRKPQDGRILYDNHGKFDIRVSVLPAMFGEKVVLRLLKKDAIDLDIRRLGFTPIQLQNYLRGIKKTHGIVLISGPTGSGKTTTLYATLKILNNQTSNILTIEDPVEYTLEGVNQVQLKEDIGLTFAKALRTFLRQDPDVIMLGEIRDKETAQMAIRASLTGHLVLSTIHTNSAWEIISRLKDMGIPGYLLGSTINLAVAQRLVRVLCPTCKKKVPFEAEPNDIHAFGNNRLEDMYVPVGCPDCSFTGYKGRKAVYEVIPIDPEMGRFIRSGKEDEDFLNQKGFETMSQVAFKLMKEGITSKEEIIPLLISDSL